MKNLQLVCITCQMFWKLINRISRYGLPNQDRQLGGGMVIPRVDMCACVTLLLSQSGQIRLIYFCFNTVYLSLLFSHDRFLIFRGLGPLLGSTESSSQLSSDEIQCNASGEDRISRALLLSPSDSTAELFRKFLKEIIDQNR